PPARPPHWRSGQQEVVERTPPSRQSRQWRPSTRAQMAHMPSWTPFVPPKPDRDVVLNAPGGRRAPARKVTASIKRCFRSGQARRGGSDKRPVIGEGQKNFLWNQRKCLKRPVPINTGLIFHGISVSEVRASP